MVFLQIFAGEKCHYARGLTVLLYVIDNYEGTMQFKALLFDLDGTLLNTLDDLADTANSALGKFGYPQHPTEKYRYFVGDGMRTLIERIMPSKSSQDEIIACEGVFQNLYAQHWADKTCPYEGIEEMLDGLQNIGMQLAILSNKPDEFTRMCVQRYFPSVDFACVQGQLAEIPKKPHPQGALMIAKKLELPPESVLYVGDTATDMKTGKGAGMTTAGVLWGFREVEELRQNGADYIVGHPREIIGLCR
jgi:phosphoglycolate phosphatase